MTYDKKQYANKQKINNSTTTENDKENDLNSLQEEHQLQDNSSSDILNEKLIIDSGTRKNNNKQVKFTKQSNNNTTGKNSDTNYRNRNRTSAGSDNKLYSESEFDAQDNICVVLGGSGDRTNTTDEENDENDDDDETRHWWQDLRLKSAAGHVGLLLSLMVYCAVGGLVFRALEQPAELSRQIELKDQLDRERAAFLAGMANSMNANNDDVDGVMDVNETTTTLAGTKMSTGLGKDYIDVLSARLWTYEQALESAVSGGFRFSVVDDAANGTQIEQVAEKWNILQAVFFSSTVLTTIGYGNIVPVTFWGRVFCIPFAIIGIPLTLTVVADWGRLFASAVSGVARGLPEMPKRYRQLSASPRAAATRRWLYVLGAVAALGVYLSAGAGLFMLWERDWTFFDGFYFCFVTMTTIGFGDLVPTRPNYMLLCTLYILIGMALTSTFIELVRRQYARSWRRLAQAMSGPLLAEGLRRLAQAGGGSSNAANGGGDRRTNEVLALQNDLRRVLTVSMPSRRRSQKHKQDEWERAVEAMLRDISCANEENAARRQTRQQVVQIVVYESSV